MLDSITNRGKTMSKIKYAVVLIVAMFALASSGVSASAAVTSLTWTQFKASAGYMELEAKNQATETYLQSQQALKFDLEAKTSIFGESMTANLAVTSTKSASYATLTVADTLGDSEFIEFGFADGSYYEAYTPEGVTGVPNLSAALSRMKKTGSSYIKLDTAVAPEHLEDVSPATLFSSENLDPLGDYNENLATMTFSEVTKTANSINSANTDYKFAATLPAAGLSPAVDLLVITTVDAADHVVEAKSSASVTGMTIETTFKVSVPVNATVTVPLESQSVHLKALMTMGKRIGAEKLVTTKAKAIATKAKALAKAAKKTLVAKHITDAAKALKYKITLVKNGAKISTSYQGVTGSMCVVATKGVAEVSNC